MGVQTVEGIVELQMVEAEVEVEMETETSSWRSLRLDPERQPHAITPWKQSGCADSGKIQMDVMFFSCSH